MMKQILNKKMIIIIVAMIIAIVLIPLKTFADDTVSIKLEDEIFYNKLVEKLGDSISTKDPTTKTITMTQTNIDKVTKLDLKSPDDAEDSAKIKNVAGIENFKNLTSLVLGNNNIDDAKDIAKLTNLTELLLYKNHITDISPIISNLKNLQTLSVGANNVTDLSNISNLTNLKSLKMYKNKLKDADVSEIGKITTLTELELYENEIKDISFISTLVNLELLELHDNQITNIKPLEHLTKLKRAYLHKNDIKDISPITDKKFEVLNDLCVGENDITDISGISNLKNLTILWLYKNKITDISELSELTNLKNLYLYSNNISDITPISNLTNIEKLNLAYNELTQTLLKGGIKEVELPQIIKAAKDSNSTVYTEYDYELINCMLSSDKTKIIIDTDKVSTVSIKIKGGKAADTIFTVNVVEDKQAPKLEITYSTKEPTSNKVRVEIKSDEIVKNPIGWNWDETKKVLYKEYSSNTEETVLIKDLAGNSTTQKISISNIVEQSQKDIENNQDSSEKEQKPSILPKTGFTEKTKILFSIMSTFALSIITFIKLKKYKEIF